MFFCEQCCNIAMQCCNIAMQCCNIDVQVARSTLVKFTPVFNVYYKIKGKFVPHACNICIFNFQINSKRHLACKPIGKRVCLQL